MPTQTYTPTFDGSPHEFVVPTGVTEITVTCVGAAGAAIVGSGTPGNGGLVKCRVTVTPAETLYLWVGDTPTVLGATGIGGLVGGESLFSGSGTVAEQNARKGNGGGGGSVITRGTSQLWTAQTSILVVGPGGGGAAGTGSAAGGDGGTPSGSAGGNASPATGGGGGTASAGGAGGDGTITPTLDGQDGFLAGFTFRNTGGASGASFSDVQAGGGGGGGYRGGGGGGASAPLGTNNAGGGGGAGLSTGVNELIQNGVNDGDGYITIRYPLGGIFVDGAVH